MKRDPKTIEPPSGTLRPAPRGNSRGPERTQVPRAATEGGAAFSLVPSSIPGSEVLLLEAAPSPPEPGERIGRYFVTSVLGRGAMGMVLRAKDDILQRDVALKVILPEYLAREPTAGLNFLREGEIVASLDHPHIVRVLDAGFDAGIAYLAFAFIDGPSFASLALEGPRAMGECSELLLPILDAIDCAHEAGVVHGDLKPTNLFLGRDHRKRPHPLVLDFGTSFVRSEGVRSHSPKGRAGGTIGYQAPEWLKGGEIDHRADIFSLGCILYELLSGKGPFSTASRLSEAYERARRSEFVPASELTGCPEAVDELIEHALAPNPGARLPSASEFARRLQAIS